MYENIDDKLNSNDELNFIIENYIILIKTMMLASEIIKKIVRPQVVSIIQQGKRGDKIV